MRALLLTLFLLRFATAQLNWNSIRGGGNSVHLPPDGGDASENTPIYTVSEQAGPVKPSIQEVKKHPTNKEPWCHRGAKYPEHISWSEAELLAKIDEYKRAGVRGSWSNPQQFVGYRAHYDMSNAIETYCKDNFLLAALLSKGTPVWSSPTPNHSYGTVFAYVPNVPNPWTHEKGVQFQCQMCDYYPLPELPKDVSDDQPLDNVVIKLHDDVFGMTWTEKASGSDRFSGTVTVGCGTCNAMTGDTHCKEERPLLCFNPLNAPKPSWVTQTPTAYMWSGGVVATTPPVSPLAARLDTIAQANKYCADRFGPDWRVAEFHDGDSWNFHAYGGVSGNPGDRFWVDINSTAEGNCWSR